MGYIVSRLDEDTVIQIETESSGAFNKGDLEIQPDPERAVFQTVETVQRLSRVLAAGILPTVRDVRASGFEIAYRVKIDASGAVAISSNPSEGQFQVTLRWSSNGGRDTG